VPTPSPRVKLLREITPEMVQAKLHELLRAKIPRRLVVNIGTGRIQDAHVEVKEHLR
jgi:hypothetical protein